MFFEIASASLNLGCYYGGLAFWTIAWIGIYAFYAYLVIRIANWCGKKIAEGLIWLRDKIKRAKDNKEKET